MAGAIDDSTINIVAVIIIIIINRRGNSCCNVTSEKQRQALPGWFGETMSDTLTLLTREHADNRMIPRGIKVLYGDGAMLNSRCTETDE